MYRLKITKPTWAKYSGFLGPVKFVEGISVEPVTERMADRIACSTECIFIDDDGRQVGVAGVATRLIGGASKPLDHDTKPLSRVTDKELDAEKAREALKNAKAPTEYHSAEQLKKIADAEGIRGLREIGGKWAVKGRAIPELIKEILTAQAAFKERVAKLAAGSEDSAADEQPEAEDTSTLVGSSVLAATYEIAGETVQLGDIVNGAFERFAGTVEAWNALKDDDREALLRLELDRLLAEAPEDEPAKEDESSEGEGEQPDEAPADVADESKEETPKEAAKADAEVDFTESDGEIASTEVKA